jgi:hypothetical protein
MSLPTCIELTTLLLVHSDMTRLHGVLSWLLVPACSTEASTCVLTPRLITEAVTWSTSKSQARTTGPLNAIGGTPASLLDCSIAMRSNASRGARGHRVTAASMETHWLLRSWGGCCLRRAAVLAHTLGRSCNSLIKYLASTSVRAHAAVLHCHRGQTTGSSPRRHPITHAVNEGSTLCKTISSAEPLRGGSLWSASPQITSLTAAMEGRTAKGSHSR